MHDIVEMAAGLIKNTWQTSNRPDAETLIQQYFEMPSRKIAAIYGVQPGAVRGWISQLRQILKLAMSKYSCPQCGYCPSKQDVAKMDILKKKMGRPPRQPDDKPIPKQYAGVLSQNAANYGVQSDTVYTWAAGTEQKAAVPEHVCPQCGNGLFYVTVTAHVAQNWKVDRDGNFLECMGSCDEAPHKATDSDIWCCASCGRKAPGYSFIKSEEAD